MGSKDKEKEKGKGSSNDTSKLQQQIDDLLKALQAQGAQTDELKKQVDALVAKNKPDDLARLYDDFRRKYQYGDNPPPPPPPPPPPVVVTKPTEGKEQFEKGGNKDPSTWVIVPMKKDPKLFKIVDNKGINIAVEYSSQAIAQQEIDYYKSLTVPPPVDHSCVPGFHWDDAAGHCVPDAGPPPPPPTGGKDQFGVAMIYPTKAGGKTVTDFTLEEKIRNYASGKPSEPSVEYTNDSGTPLLNKEWTYYVMINGFKAETDTISNKVRGGHHSSSNPVEGTCYDLGVSTDGSGDKALQVERPHPSMHDGNVTPLFTLGTSVVKKWLGIKAIDYNLPGDKGVHLEMQLDFPVLDINSPPNNWRKYWELDDTGQVPSGMIVKPFGNLSTSRIDGVVKGDPPSFKYASIREIDPAGPVVDPHLCPAGQVWSDAQGKCIPIPTHTCPSGQVWNPATNTCEDIPVPPQGGTIDVEGIQMLYADDVGRTAQQWFLSRSDRGRLSGKGQRKDGSGGTIEITPDPGTNPPSARIYISTTNPKAFDEATQVAQMKDWVVMAARPDADGINRGGWALNDYDYRDTEVTHYYRIPKIATDDEMTQYWRGGNHPHGGYPLQCISFAYKIQIQTKDCSPRSAIEWNHEAGADGYAWNDTVKPKFDLKAALGGTMENKVIGQKAVFWNEFNSSGKIVAVHLEEYVDIQSKDLAAPDFAKQRWDLLAEYIHTGEPGNWASAKNMNQLKGCNGESVKMGTWGGPFIALRFDASNWVIYALSIRPILPGRKLV